MVLLFWFFFFSLCEFITVSLMFRHRNTRQDMKKYKMQDLQISVSLVVETVLISVKTGNYLVAYV